MLIWYVFSSAENDFRWIRSPLCMYSPKHLRTDHHDRTSFKQLGLKGVDASRRRSHPYLRVFSLDNGPCALCSCNCDQGDQTWPLANGWDIPSWVLGHVVLLKYVQKRYPTWTFENEVKTHLRVNSSSLWLRGWTGWHVRRPGFWYPHPLHARSEGYA